MHKKKVSIKQIFGDSTLLYEAGLESIKSILTNRQTYVITDSLLSELYAAELSDCELVIIPQGEKAKTLTCIGGTAQRLLEKGADRGSHLVAFGGGAICDFTGFLASIFMRGISFSLVPTTLLAQVDAALGGKTGVNLGHLKNMLGRFAAPENVLIQPTYTNSQLHEDWICGLAETAKHAVIADVNFFEWLESNKKLIMERVPETISELVMRSGAIKLGIVSTDSTEQNLRKLLNFGHTVGHALELRYDLLHGHAISLGMAAELTWMESEGILPIAEKIRIQALLQAFSLPVNWKDYQPNVWIDALDADKKTAGTYIDFPVITQLGSASVMRIPLSRIREFYVSHTE